MSSAGDVGTHQSGLCVEHIRIDLFQLITAFIVVAVAGGGGKACGTDPVFAERSQYLGLIVFRYLIDRLKRSRNRAMASWP